MSLIRQLFGLSSCVLITACSTPAVQPMGDPALSFPGEIHLKNLRQLTFGGTNAEAYWSFDGRNLSFQHKGQHKGKGLPGGDPSCDQIYWMKANGMDPIAISKNKGRTTCAYFTSDDQRILFSSTYQGKPESETCPTPPDLSQGYVWPIYNTYQMYSTLLDGSDFRPVEPGAPRAYNAEATVCKDGSVVFTSDRDGDLELYIGKLNSMHTLTDLKRITHTPGYDGGAFFSHDCSQIIWRASRPRPGKEMEDYQALLKQHLVRPGKLELWIANADGTHARQVTRIGSASFAPYLSPDNQSIIFSSNPRNPGGRLFDLYRIRTNGTRLEQVTFSNVFDSFPIFSPDGKYLAFSSNRNAKAARETNIFIADWVEGSPLPISMDDKDPANRLQATIETLSAPEMEGRGMGSAGLTKAVDLIAERFKKIGLKPFFETFQKVPHGEGYKHFAEFRIPDTDKITSDQNVLGTWGNGCGKTPAVLLGAHVDHLGHGAPNSMEPSKTGIHPGADDNASGVAGLLEVAQKIASTPEMEKSTCFAFAAFVGEEVGTGGSARLVEDLKKGRALPKVMLNLDMIGRMENNTVIVFGTESAKEWKELLEPSCAEFQLKCPGGGDGYTPSDQMAFYLAGIPVLHFFTGAHEDYHRTTDTADKINATGALQTVDLAVSLALKSMPRKQRFTYQKSTSPTMFGRLGFERQRAKSGAYLGTIPDFSAMTDPKSIQNSETGVKLAGARTGSPGEKAGIKQGDVIFGIENEAGLLVLKPINTLEDFMNVLVELKPTQKVQLLIRRDGKKLKLPAEIGKKE